MKNAGFGCRVSLHAYPDRHYTGIVVEEQARSLQKLKLAACGKTDTGLKRNHNEDNILVSVEHGIFAVADGMGGHAAGEVASLAVVETLGRFIEQTGADPNFTWPFGRQENCSYPENLLITGIQLANREICVMAENDAKYNGMGTTVAAVYMAAAQVQVAHVGDSRVYIVKNGEFKQITEDHSWVNEQLQRNIITEEEARNHRWRNVITRALGNRPEIEVEIQSLPAEAGDLYMLCSDGLTTMVEDARIAEIIAEGRSNLELCASQLVGEANAAGGFDNISVVLVEVQPPGDNDPEETAGAVEADDDAETIKMGEPDEDGEPQE